MTIYTGFTDIKLTHSHGTNPESENSIVLFAEVRLNNMYDASEPYALISQVITSESEKDFTEDEVFSIKDITFTDSRHSNGAYGPITVKMVNGTERKINFSKIEKHLSL